MKYQMTMLELAVSELYQLLEIHKPKQLDMNAIAQKLNVRLLFSQFNSFVIETDKPEININGRQSLQQQWEDFGHEIGHLIRHSGNQLTLPPEMIQLQEIKADNFALQFCVPTFMLRRMYLPKLRNHAVCVISETFHVTHSFADRRLLHFERQIEGMLFHEYLWTGKIAETRTDYFFNH